MSVRRSAVCLLWTFPVLWSAAALAGCRGGEANGEHSVRWSGTVDTAAYGRVTVTNTGAGAWRQDPVRARRTLLIGEAIRYRLLVVPPDGDTVRTVRRAVDRRPIPEAVRRESADALRTRLDTLPVPADEVTKLPAVVADGELPARYPAHLEVRVGEDGRMWAERPPVIDRPEATPDDVFDRAGVYLGTVVVPGRFDSGRGFTNARMRPRPVFTESAVYGVVKDSVTGVQRVARFAYELPGREEDAPPVPPMPCSTNRTGAVP